ncbi:SprB repeat-containing protein [Lewinella sp. LCG006]|uniref:SprB repeat-containing protein n=1 Tax=Lewinella sp. LCG006 TaxID=3231911 RepID=UPI00345FD26F
MIALLQALALSRGLTPKWGLFSGVLLVILSLLSPLKTTYNSLLKSQKRTASIFHHFMLIWCLIGGALSAKAQTVNETISSGSFIINMGVTPQTEANGLKPYGLVYDLLENYQVPIKWVINPTKTKDGVDFTYNGLGYRGGPFIIPAEFRTTAVNARITFWQGQGVIGTTTTSPITVPVFTTMNFAPNWTLDLQNGAIVTSFFAKAGIPSSAYGGSSSNWKLPSQLGPCDDIFAMPHADPVWSSHSNLLNWNQSYLGAIWYGCHAGSALEDMFNPAIKSQQTNFLAEKTGTATGNGPYAENALLLWDNHSDGTPAYSYDYPTDPVMQFMERMDKATENGSEQIYLPLSPGWRPTTKVGVYDPDHPQRVSGAIQHRAAVMAWGRGYGNPDRGWVLMQAGHDIAESNKKENVAAQRVFFNFAFQALIGKVVLPSVSEISPNTVIAPGEPLALSVTVPPPANINDFTYQWTSSCGGTFSPSNTVANPTFTPPNGSGSYQCIITVSITDPCNRTSFSATSVNVACNLQIATNLTQPCNGLSNGVINMTVTGGSSVTYTWTRSGGGSGSGSGTTISGLSSGTYTVNITTSNGCTASFTRTLLAPPAIVPTATPTPVACFGQNTGSISLTVTGGTPGYTYAWNDGPTTANRSNLSVGTYTITVTDANGCTAITSAAVTQPSAALSATPTVTNVACFGETTGAINLMVSGGTTPYNYLWNDGASSQNRTGLTAGTYAVTVTDANNCTQAVTNIIVTQPASALSLTATQTNANCGGPTGSITVTAMGGTSPYSYDWSGTPVGDGTMTITSLNGGTYAVTVTDANGCTAVLSTTITQAPPLVISISPINPTCPPGAAPPINSDGSIDLMVMGGTPTYSYAWTTADGSGLNPTAEDQTGLTAGTYSVTVTDANGCTASVSTSLVFENQLPITPGVINNN